MYAFIIIYNSLLPESNNSDVIGTFITFTKLLKMLVVYLEHDIYDNKVDSGKWIRFDHSDSKVILCDFFLEYMFIQ
jgi:hypothetical protein